MIGGRSLARSRADGRAVAPSVSPLLTGLLLTRLPLARYGRGARQLVPGGSWIEFAVAGLSVIKPLGTRSLTPFPASAWPLPAPIARDVAGVSITSTTAMTVLARDRLCA